MKRIFYLITALPFVIPVAGCGKPTTTSADSITQPAAAPAESDVVEKANPVPQKTANPVAQKTTIPEGTKLRVALIDTVSSDKNRSGDQFQASLVEPVVVDGKTILEKGTKVRGRVLDAKESGRVKGRATVELALTQVVLKDGKTFNVSTKPYTAVAAATKKRDAAIIGGGAGLGAAIGALAGGGKGALVGAAVGGGAGTGTVLATKGTEIHYAPETRLQFTLASPVEI
jgi:hypothetical protein